MSRSWCTVCWLLNVMKLSVFMISFFLANKPARSLSEIPIFKCLSYTRRAHSVQFMIPYTIKYARMIHALQTRSKCCHFRCVEAAWRLAVSKPGWEPESSSQELSVALCPIRWSGCHWAPDRPSVLPVGGTRWSLIPLAPVLTVHLLPGAKIWISHNVHYLLNWCSLLDYVFAARINTTLIVYRKPLMWIQFNEISLIGCN